MKNFIIGFLLVFTAASLNAQMEVNGQTLYGNEWIDYSKKYIKISVSEDGMVRVDQSQLRENGFSSTQITGAALKLFNYGQEVPLYVTSDGNWSANDYLLFYGEAQDGLMDSYLFNNPEEEQINPDVSMFSDINNYYLVLDSGSNNLRYTSRSNDVNGSGLVKESFFLEKIKMSFSEDVWTTTSQFDPSLEFSNFVMMDGFSSYMQNDQTVEMEILDFYENGPDPEISARIGSNNSDHYIQLEFNSNPVLNDIYFGSKVKQYKETVDKGNIRNNNTNYIRLRGSTMSDALSIAMLELCYPRTYSAENEGVYHFYSGDDNLDEYVEIPNFKNGSNPLVFDLDNMNVIVPEVTGSSAHVVIPGGAVKQAKIVLVTEEEYNSPMALESTEFSNLENIDPEYLILTSKKLNKEEGGRNAINEYADFRTSALGGEYKVGIVNVEDLYEQFGYGVENHCQAIKNFAAFMHPKWSDHELTFIIGKALAFTNKNKNTIARNFVPTYGKPGSDNLLFATEGNSFPNMGVGRLAAQKQSEILAYLDKAEINAKLKDVENLTIEERLWLKNVIHLSGGDPRIQAELFNHLSRMENIIEANQYGGSVETFRRISSDPVTTALTEEILNTINEGISMLTFFGHSSAGTFDFSVDDPSEYENYGKHPVIFAMGCHAGDIHENTYSLSENFILTPELGAIAFMASSGNAYPDALASVGYKFYDQIGEQYYGQPIGTVVQSVLEEEFTFYKELYDDSQKVLPLYETFKDNITLIQQNTLHGDPAVRFFHAEAPDYVVDLSSIMTMEVVGTLDDHIELNFDIVNLGAGSQVDSLENYIIHTYGNGQTQRIDFKSAAVKNRDNVTVIIPNPGEAALGKNSINIILDHPNNVPEVPDPIAEENNDLTKAWSVPEGFCFYIFDNNVNPIYPAEFAIVGDRNVTLMASSPNALGDETYYQIQLDTTSSFDSPLLVTEDVLAAPGLIKWTPGFDYQEETVYYWRVKNRDASQSIWSDYFSFVFLEGEKSGWNQSHFYQWTKDEFSNTRMDTTSNDLVYVNTLFDIRIKNGVYPDAVPGITYQNNPINYLHYPGEIMSGIYMSTFDGDTGIGDTNDPTVGGEYGSHVEAQWVGDEFICFPFRTDTKPQRANAINFIEEVVPSGDYIALFTIQRNDGSGSHYNPRDWADDAVGGDPDLMSILEKYGATQVRSLQNEVVPYIFIFKKDDPSFTPVEIKATNVSEKINAEFKINARWFEGDMTSTTIGPASSWDKLLWNIDQLDLIEDSYQLDVIGIDYNGEETMIYPNVDEFTRDLSEIPADVFPYLKLNLFTKDEKSRTSPQLPFWRVLYSELPEAVLDVSSSFVFQSDTMARGDLFKFHTVATNITQVDMDSLDVEFVVTDENNQIITSAKVLEPLKGLSSVDLEFELGTNDLIGLNQFKVEINPRATQKEQYYFNNLGLRSFFVIGDKTNPLLDVTFDGVRIMNGDLISPNPTISVLLKDENSFNPITDINSFELELKDLSNGGESYEVDLTADNVIFYPADSTNNYCASIEFTPEFESGEYELLVQGKDANGNLSGDRKMSITFEVETKSMVTNVLNYPNPFSTSTEFIFTLTGRQVPDVFTIQIYSMSGKVVKEISKDELGPLKIGLNRTRYKWDGTDDFGNKLANGVYVYRLITSEVEGEKIEHRNNFDIDNYFKKGFGKLVIMR